MLNNLSSTRKKPQCWLMNMFFNGYSSVHLVQWDIFRVPCPTSSEPTKWWRLLIMAMAIEARFYRQPLSAQYNIHSWFIHSILFTLQIQTMYFVIWYITKISNIAKHFSTNLSLLILISYQSISFLVVLCLTMYVTKKFLFDF